MKTLSPFAVIFLIAYLAVYLIFSFGYWNLNPAHWDGLSRGMAALFGTIIGCFASAIYSDK